MTTPEQDQQQLKQYSHPKKDNSMLVPYSEYSPLLR